MTSDERDLIAWNAGSLLACISVAAAQKVSQKESTKENRKVHVIFSVLKFERRSYE